MILQVNIVMSYLITIRLLLTISFLCNQNNGPAGRPVQELCQLAATRDTYTMHMAQDGDGEPDDHVRCGKHWENLMNQCG